MNPDLFTRTPELYPHSYDVLNDMVYLVAMSEADFRAASFLDQRALVGGKTGEWRPWRDVESAATRLEPARPTNYIFHISHVGSTLLSRLLGAHRQVFALREPTPLRVFASTHLDRAEPESPLSPEAWTVRLAGFSALWSRTWTPDQTTLIKATSIACALADDLLSQPAAGSALMMFVQPEAFLASILAAPNSPTDIRAGAQLRLRRLHARLGEPAWRLYDLSLGEMIAMSWACEMVTLRDAARGRETRVRWVEFDRFLAAPGAGLADLFGALGVAATPKQITAIVQSPLMRQYAKAPEHAYDAALRRDVLSSGFAQHGAEIRRGLHWLDRAAQTFPEVRDAREFAPTV